MLVLGISGLYHDSAAAVCRDGMIIAAAQEERFTRKKHDLNIPWHAIDYCVKEAGTSVENLDCVVYYDNPILTLDRVVKNMIALGNEGRLFAERNLPSLLHNKIWIEDHLKAKYGKLGKGDVLYFTEHHISHCASAFYPSPFDNAAILTIDGVGEWTSTAIGAGRGTDIEIIKRINYPHSLGLLYSAFTYFCGFKVNSGDYKFMGLAPYGEPVYVDIIKEKLIDIKSDGSFQLNLEYFDFYKNDVMISSKFADLFGGERRYPEAVITKREMDIAASAQKVTEEVIISLARHAKEITGMKNIVMAGGVALNCVANGKLLREAVFDDIWIQPAAGDAGGALGAALYAEYQLGKGKRIAKPDAQQGSYLGPKYCNDDIRHYLDKEGYKYHYIDKTQELHSEIAELLEEGKVIGLFQGRMEYGPRALGNRSIIADARSEEMQAKINLKIKYRESFRPFAPSVMEEDVDKYFELSGKSPYMLIVADVNEDRRKPFNVLESLADSDYDMLKVVKSGRSDIPAVTHVDYSARIQTVSKKTNPYFYGVLEAYKKRTNCSVLVNTSFNVRGEPIVCSPQDAYRCFMRTEMDVLVLENCILYKSEQDSFIDYDWQNEFMLD